MNAPHRTPETHQWTDPACAIYRAPSYPLGMMIHRALSGLRCKTCRKSTGADHE